jgi:transcriptional regulator with XRE-family HTH domain
MQEWTMAVHSRLRILIAERNLERAREGLSALSVRQIAEGMDVDHTRLQRLVNGGDTYKLEMMDKLMQFFQLTSFDQLFEYTERGVPPG